MVCGSGFESASERLNCLVTKLARTTCTSLYCYFTRVVLSIYSRLIRVPLLHACAEFGFELGRVVRSSSIVLQTCYEFAKVRTNVQYSISTVSKYPAPKRFNQNGQTRYIASPRNLLFYFILLRDASSLASEDTVKQRKQQSKSQYPHLRLYSTNSNKVRHVECSTFPTDQLSNFYACNKLESTY